MCQNIENYLVDVRFQLLPSCRPDDRIFLVSIDEVTLQSDSTYLAEKADEIGTLLQRILDAGARGIAIDFLLPERWSQSESFAKLILRNQGKLILASYIKKDGNIIGLKCIRGLITAALDSKEKVEALFGFLNLEPDSDDRIRRMQIGLRNQEGKWMYSISARAFQILTRSELSDEQVQQRLWIDHSIDWNKFQKISWKDLLSFLRERPDLFQDRIVLIGGEYEGSQDFHKIPHRSGLPDDEVSGLIVHSLTLSTLLQDKPIRDVSGLSVFVLLAIVVICFSSVILINSRVLPFFIILCVFSTGYVLGAHLLFIWNRQLLQVGVPLIGLTFILALALSVRRKLTFVEKPSREVKRK